MDNFQFNFRFSLAEVHTIRSMNRMFSPGGADGMKDEADGGRDFHRIVRDFFLILRRMNDSMVEQLSGGADYCISALELCGLADNSSSDSGSEGNVKDKEDAGMEEK